MLPHCPNVEDLTLRDTKAKLSVLRMASSSGSGWKLKTLTIDDAEDLKLVPNHCMHQLSFLRIIADSKLESSKRLEEMFTAASSSLKNLEFSICNKLRSISKGLEHLTALESLTFSCCKELDITGNANEDGMPWKAFNTSLRSLVLTDLPKLVVLPSGLRHLANLRSLCLSYNYELKQLPEWISCLTSLEYLHVSHCPKLKYLPEAFRNLIALDQLRIVKCPGLTEQCRHPSGAEWHKIQHIHTVSVID